MEHETKQAETQVKVDVPKETHNMLVPLEMYLKSGIHIGTKFKTSYMDEFVYKTKPDGLYVLNLQKIDERIAIASTMLAKYKTEDILIVSRRENSWKAAKAFGRVTGIRSFVGRYPPGVLTNPALESFIEAKLMIVTDAWPDRNAVADAIRVGIPIIGLCDTNNQANNLDLVVPCNNKGKKSLGLLFYIMAREYLIKTGMLEKGQEPPFKLEEFVEE